MSSKATVRFKIPGKSFLIGEYVALFGGPSLVLTTNPSFEIVFKSGSGRHPFHRESPAGKYIGEHPNFFLKWDVEFHDPYGSGGFGASTAQFIAASLMRAHDGDLAYEKFFSTKSETAIQVWREYREQFSGAGQAPSGADLVAQVAGGLSVFDGNTISQESLPWPFAGKDILLFKTGQKIPTHEHLADVFLDGGALSREMGPVAEAALSSLKNADWPGWMEAQRNFGKILAGHGLVHPDTELLLRKIATISGVVGARGCGALGADVIAVTIESEKMAAIVNGLGNLKFVASLLKDQAYGTWLEVM